MVLRIAPKPGITPIVGALLHLPVELTESGNVGARRMTWSIAINAVTWVAIGFSIWSSHRTHKRAKALQLELMSYAPPPPENVTIHLRDGRVVPVSCVLDPVRMWDVIVPEWIKHEDVLRVACDAMPPMAGLNVAFRRITE